MCEVALNYINDAKQQVVHCERPTNEWGEPTASYR